MRTGKLVTSTTPANQRVTAITTSGSDSSAAALTPTTAMAQARVAWTHKQASCYHDAHVLVSVMSAGSAQTHDRDSAQLHGGSDDAHQ
jgi:hypothetical protein